MLFLRLVEKNFITAVEQRKNTTVAELFAEKFQVEAGTHYFLHNGVLLRKSKDIACLPCNATIQAIPIVAGGKKKKKAFSTEKRKKSQKKRPKLEILRQFKFSEKEGKPIAEFQRHFCHRKTCGKGYSLARHKSTLTCGNCGRCYKLEQYEKQLEAKKKLVAEQIN